MKTRPGITKIRVPMTALAKTTKNKTKKTPRQLLLGAIMKHASGDRGEEMCNAFAEGKVDKLREMMDSMTDAVVKKASKQ